MNKKPDSNQVVDIVTDPLLLIAMGAGALVVTKPQGIESTLDLFNMSMICGVSTFMGAGAGSVAGFIGGNCLHTAFNAAVNKKMELKLSMGRMVRASVIAGALYGGSVGYDYTHAMIEEVFCPAFEDRKERPKGPPIPCPTSPT